MSRFRAPPRKWGCPKGQSVLPTLGPQIELNLVPAMTERSVVITGARLKSATEIEFFVARKLVRAAIFESLILEFVTRLREGSKPVQRKLRARALAE